MGEAGQGRGARRTGKGLPSRVNKGASRQARPRGATLCLCACVFVDEGGRGLDEMPSLALFCCCHRIAQAQRREAGGSYNRIRLGGRTRAATPALAAAPVGGEGGVLGSENMLVG
jgi:hypothetical protein